MNADPCARTDTITLSTDSEALLRLCIWNMGLFNIADTIVNIGMYIISMLYACYR